MLPKSIKREKYETGRVKIRKYCLVVDNDADVAEDYKQLILDIYPNTHVECCRQAEAAAKARDMGFHLYLIDSDSFKIKEHPGLKTVEKMGDDIDLENTIYMSPVSMNPELKTEYSSYFANGMRLIEKGKWQELEGAITEILSVNLQ
jgi:hypothetical protein